jgi:plasmid stability protein
MGQVLVRNLDDRVIERLKTKAELKGSLEQELREKIALFRELRAMTPRVGEVDVRAQLFGAAATTSSMNDHSRRRKRCLALVLSAEQI